MPYQPDASPDAKGGIEWAREEFARLSQSLTAPQLFITLAYLHREPSRVKPGMVVLADGTDWDPGSGAGMYRRNEANTAWVFCG